MKETDRLATILFPQGSDKAPTLVNLKFFPGDGAASTAEFRNEAHKAIHFVSKGLCERRTRFGAERAQVDIDDFLSIA